MTTRRELEQFLGRPWDVVRESKDRHNATRGAEALIEAGDELYRWAEDMGARKTDIERARDLSALVRMKKALDRASAKRSHRPR